MTSKTKVDATYVSFRIRYMRSTACKILHMADENRDYHHGHHTRGARYIAGHLEIARHEISQALVYFKNAHPYQMPYAQ
jgi:hypothetical protein